MINYKMIADKLILMDKTIWIGSSAVRKENGFTDLIKGLNPKPTGVVEIGTFRGLATLVLASVAKKVYTFDVIYQESAEEIWEIFGVRDKIEYVIIDAHKKGYDPELVKTAEPHEAINKYIDHAKANAGIKKYLEDHDVQANTVFIDGQHKHREAKADHEITKQYGRTIFHDVAWNYPGIEKLMKEIGAKIINEFGYWQDKSKPGK